ncbi:hypothetical protein U8335_02445 [Roseiconus lacunae]|uniref:AAA+ ATPase domain-containing protein n=1 Tax=Roseiconus lacunae TaxID=2605694 RepID=A0ABT7PQA9_9BACT|nr:ATP-binding protein [Roseiconus lacunae]MCD0462810.1 ATP-binding protein [Roseiconus lacunae]MDM4018635.1 hypothetical protein [Roseiconus lacunae]WRQ51403.1 hypothetical protein U8335_02445 [Stieleria sp. HD01]
MKPAFEYQLSNPFSTSFIAPSKVRYRFNHGVSGGNPQTVEMHLEGLLATLRKTRRGLILGPHGTGKSTLLHTFLPKLQRSYPMVAFHQINNDPSIGWIGRMKERSRASGRIRKELAELPREGLLIVDGWEQLYRVSRLRILKTAAAKKITILATSHQRMTGWSTIHETKPTSKLIQSLAGDLLADTPYEIRKLVDRYLKQCRVTPKTNVRDLWFEMYDLVEDAHSSGPQSVV